MSVEGLLRLLRRHAAVVWLSLSALVVLGIAAARTMPSGIYPEVEFPRVVVVARGGGATPEVFITSVTRPLEQALATVLGVQRIRSRTIRGATEISLQFAPDSDMPRAAQLVEGRVNEVRGTLPQGIETVVERITTGSFPVVTFNVSGPVDSRQLREIAELTMRPAFASIPGVGRVEVLGGDVREIEIVLDPEKTAAAKLTPVDVATTLRSAIGLDAVGRVERDRQIVTALSDAQPRSLAELRALPIARTATGGTLPLETVADVYEGAEDRTLRVGGPRGETVSVAVSRLPGSSTPEVVDAAIAVTRALLPSMAKGIEIDPVYDQALLVHDAIANVRDAILLGIALCAAVIALFLRDLRAGLLAAVTVPLTLSITFLAMRLAHQTLNLMSLGGMAVAIGLVVDDAIVVVEAIIRRREHGDALDVAAIAGTRELAPAVIGTTLTTLVVFFPLAFLPGIVGDFFRALAFTVSVAVAISLVLAITVVPISARFVLSARVVVKPTPAAGDVPRFSRLVRWIGGRAWLAVLALLAILGGGVALAPHVGRGFLPEMDEGAFVVDYFLPAGASLAATDHFARAIEKELRATPEVLTFTRRTGAELGPVAATQLHRGDIMVRLRPPNARKRSSATVISDVRERIQAAVPEARIEFVQVLQDVLNDLAGNPRPIELKVFGPDEATLHGLAEAISADVVKVAGLVDLYDGHERESPSIAFRVRRDEAARLGLAPDQLTNQLRIALSGDLVGSVRRFANDAGSASDRPSDRLVGVRVRYPDEVRFDAQRVLDLPIALSAVSDSARDATPPMRAVFDADDATSPSVLSHEALSPAVAITADHAGRDLGSIADDVERIARAHPLPSGYRIAIGGQVEGQRATLRDLSRVAAISALLVAAVLAAQFRRPALVALVLLSVPIAIVGALASLLATGTPLNASSLMGCVLLVGLVVKNGVLLLEEAERRRDAGATALDAVVEASHVRVRPVLMTTIATLVGLFPLALGLGAGAELQRPLAIAVIGGLMTSTIATLVLLPALAAVALRTVVEVEVEA